MARTDISYHIEGRGGRNFSIVWWEGGKRRRVSTGTTDREQAEAYLAQFLAGRGSPEPPKALTIADILAGYTASRRGHVRNFNAMEVCAASVARHLGKLLPDHLTTERGRFYWGRRQAERPGKPISDGTIIRELRVLRAAFQWAKRERWIKEVPYVPVPHAPAPRNRCLSHDEADKLLAAALSHHLRLFILTALHTAARASAITELTWKQVDFDRNLIDFGRVAGGKGRSVVPMTPTLRIELQRARKGATSPFVIEYGGSRVMRIDQSIKRVAKNAGLPGITPHILRHTAASWLAMAGRPMAEIARFLGHGDSRITEQVYSHYSPDFLQGAVDVLERKRK